MYDMNEREHNRIYASGERNVASIYEHIIRIRQRYLNDVSGRVLDHGFGNGIISQYLHNEGFDVYGAESSSAAMDLIRSRISNGSQLKAEYFFLLDQDEIKLPFPYDFFHAVVSNQVINFLGERDVIDATLRELCRILAPGGKIACTVMAEDNYFFTDYGVPPVPGQGMVKVKVTGRITRNWTLYRFRDASDLTLAFEQAGFVLDDLGYFDFKLLDVICGKNYIVLARKPFRINTNNL
jgi:SAM-dependent methyltransferase